MRYTQKDIRERLGFTRDTLRLYEQRGIISPEIDPANGYRYYDDWQVNLLWDAKFYQGMGFSLSEVQEILQHDSLLDLCGRMAARVDDLAEEVRLKRLVLGETEHRLTCIREVDELMGSYRLVQHEGCYFVPKRRDHDFEGALTPAIDFSNRYASLMAPYFWFPSLGEDHYFWGYAMRSSAYDTLGVELGEGRVERFEATSALVTCVDAGERWGFGLSLFGGACRRGARPRPAACGYGAWGSGGSRSRGRELSPLPARVSAGCGRGWAGRSAAKLARRMLRRSPFYPRGLKVVSKIWC